MRKALYLGMCLLVFSVASGQTSYQTHTLYIYSFAKFVQWPEESRVGDFEIAVLGDSPILLELDKLAQKKKIGGYRSKSQKFHGLNPPASDALLLRSFSFVNSKISNLSGQKIG